MDIEDKLEALGISLPEAVSPLGSYIPVKVVGNLAFCSGVLPLNDGDLTLAGKVGADATIEQASEAAKLCVVNVLASLNSTLGGLDRIKGVARVEGFVNSAPGFIDHPKVINGASEFLTELFGDKGKHSRIAVGVSELPLDAAVEIAFIFDISP